MVTGGMMKRIVIEVAMFTALVVGTRALFAGLRWLLEPDDYPQLQ